MVGARPCAAAGRGETASCRQALAALGAAAGDDLAAVGGLHAGTEDVVALELEVAGLVGALGGHGGSRDDTRRKEPAILLCADLAGIHGACIESHPNPPWLQGASPHDTTSEHDRGGSREHVPSV